MRLKDGLKEFNYACEQAKVDIMPLIESTARWVHPDTFRQLPVWFPECARGQHRCNAEFTKQLDKRETNERAGEALSKALGIWGQFAAQKRRPPNWTVCHIWGYDDDIYQNKNEIIRDPNYYSCVGNMVLLPTPLKALTDTMPEVKRALKYCAYKHFGWVCEHPDVKIEAKKISEMKKPPPHYPKSWPTATRKMQSQCMSSSLYEDQNILKWVKLRKRQLRRLIDNGGTHFPKKEVEEILDKQEVVL